ncbi:MAG: phosphate-starvation-inducible PsiE family protein [Rubrobacter sp.]|nr:phosphate-starvation-inducible PsiE family protein [Rubrobacter sp.]MBA3791798.1 phosphate-starvation-inducible PsiE family protein [Rubrobacter sp.]
MSGRREVRERPDVGSRLSGFIELAERIVYYGAALFLLLTIVMVFLSVVAGLRDIAEAGLLQTALEILDKVLLIFIFAELLSTISTTIREREIAAEPFLLIGLIAVVRRILAVTVSIEQSLGTPRFQDLLLELGVLTALVITLSIALYFTRRSERPREPDDAQ